MSQCNKGCLDLCTNKLWGEFFELDSPCVIELFSGLKDAGRIALDSTSWSFALTDASLFSVDAKYKCHR